ncbi:MAG: DUF4062 domain-containing protein [Phycisphaerae bacterium]|nr:DUF4062 domain-containing protein [Phycisphaerae bacterium]
MTESHLNARLRPIIRVFVSSTFSDMRHERNALQADVFPKLELLCQKNGFQFQAIDLRWGVSGEAGLDHRTMRICFEELRRSQEISPRPNFLILMGNRYGWRPLPEEISEQECEELKKAATADFADGERIGGQKPLDVLNAWYCRDENAVPPVYVLQSRRQKLGDGKDYTKDEPWNEIQAILWEVINHAMPPSRMGGRFDGAREPDDPSPPITRFQASATEQEIWQGALRVPDAREHVLAFFREIADIGTVKDPTLIKDFVDVQPSGGLDTALRDEQARLKKHLRDRLGAANVFEARSVKLSTDVTTEHLPKLCSDVETRLTQIMQAQIEAYWKGTGQASTERAVRDLEIEQQEHARIGQERGGRATFVGREDKLAAIRDYLHSDSTLPLVVHGASGCGKTALMARAAQEAVEQRSEVIIRFIGTTPRSSDLRGLLTSLCQELRLRYPREGELPTEIRLLEVELQEHFKAATAEQPLILFLDALDQLADTDGGRNLHWIPVGPLPAHVKLVVSCLSDRAEQDPAGHPWTELQRRQLPAGNLIDLNELSEEDAHTLLFERWLPQAGRTVSRDQRASIEQRLKSDKCRQPIYLKLLFEEARLWRSYDAPPALGEDVSALLKQLFDRLGLPSNHGPLLVERVLGYLAASREGLAENEILEILFRDPECKESLLLVSQKTQHEMPPNAKRIPIAIWSRLRFDLASYLTERAATGANVLTFYHRQVAEWVQERFAKAHDRRWEPHSLLADYFRNLADPAKDQSWKGDSARPFLQVVFHLVGADRSDDYCQTLCDLRFVEARCRLGQVFELIADYRLAQEDLPEAQADLAEERQRQERIERWTREIIAYSKAWSDRRDRSAAGESVTEPEPALPEPPPSCRMWTEEEIQAECERIIKTPTRRDRLEAFAGFVSGQCYPLLKHGQLPGLVLQHAFNAEPAGAVHDAAVPLLAALSKPHLLRRWPPEARPNPKPVCLRTLEGHSSCVSRVSVTPNGCLAASKGTDDTVRVWDLESGQCLGVIENVCERGISITPDGCRVVSGGTDHVIQVWNVESRECLQTIKGHTNAVIAASVSPDGKLAVSGGADRTVRVWDLDRGVCLQTLVGHADWVHGVSLLPDGRFVLSGSFDKTLKLWQLNNGTCLRTLRGHTHLVSSVSVTPDCRQAVSGGMDSTVRSWDLETGECLRVFEHADEVYCVSVTPDGKRVVSGSRDCTVRVWDLESGRCLCALAGHSASVNDVSITPDGRRIVSASSDGTVRVWDIGRSQPVRPHKDQGGPMWSLAVANNARHVISANMNTPQGLLNLTENYRLILRLWSIESGTCLHTLLCPPTSHSDVVDTTADGRRAISGHVDGLLRVWDMESGACLRWMKGYTRSWRSFTVTCVRVTMDGRQVVSGGQDGKLRVWDLETGALVHTMVGNAETIIDISMTPDGERVVSCSEDSTLRVWDLETGECLRTMADHIQDMRFVMAVPDGRTVLSGHANGQFVLWDLESGACLRSIWGCGQVNRRVDITPDGRHLVWAGFDKMVGISDLKQGACVGILDTPARVCSTVFTGNGLILCVGTEHGDVILFDVKGIVLGPDLKARVSTVMSDTEYEQLLCRGLEFSRRKKDVGHQETLAHLTALVVHLEKMGRTEEARVFAEERDAIIERQAPGQAREGHRTLARESQQNRRPSVPPPATTEPARAPTLDELRTIARSLYQRCLWDAAGSVFESLIAAGDPIEEIGPKLVKCLLHAHEPPLAGQLARAAEIISALDHGGHLDMAAELRVQLAAEQPPANRKPPWRRWFGGRGKEL